MDQSAAVTWSLCILSADRGGWYSWGEIHLGGWPAWLHRAAALATVIFCQVGYATLASLVLTLLAVAPPIQLMTMPHPGLLRARFHYAQGDVFVLLQLDVGVRDSATARR